MGRPKLYLTPEARAEARRRWQRAYSKSEEGRAAKAAYLATERGQAFADARYARYRETEKYRAAQARYAASAKNKAAEAIYHAEQRRMYPERIKARAAIQTRLRQGTITRPDACGNCGSGGRIDAHHHLGYAVEHWFDVQWLCRRCHKAAHS